MSLPSRQTLRRDLLLVLDSNVTLLVLLLGNFLVLSLVEDRRLGAFISTIVAGLALVTAIHDTPSGRAVTRRQAGLIGAAVLVSSAVLFIDSGPLVGWTYLVPAVLMVTLTLPIEVYRTLHHRRVTYETILGALCSYILVGLVFAFVYLAVSELGGDTFFAQEGMHAQSEYLYFSFVTLTTLGFGDLSPSVGLPQALVAIEALIGQVFLVTLVARLVTLWVRQGEPAAGAPNRG